MIRFAAVISVLAVAAATSRAEYTINVLQVGQNVVASGSGTIDLTGLEYKQTTSPSNAMGPDIALLQLGSTASTDIYAGVLGPQSFGSGGISFSDLQTGDFTAIAGAGESLELPAGYISGAPLSGASTWDNQTLSSLGLAPGTYTYIWNGGPGDDSLVVNIGPAAPVAIPEPSSISLLGAAIGCVGIGVCLRRRGAVPAAT